MNTKNIRVKTIVDEDFVSYKKASMVIGTIKCGGKCCIEAGIPLSVCQNDEWRSAPIINISIHKLCERYINNEITSSILFAGLEPFEQFDEIKEFIYILRKYYNCDDDVVIYTGYNKDEIYDKINELINFKNIIIKFGRYIPNESSIYDDILGVNLASSNQYAEKIS